MNAIMNTVATAPKQTEIGMPENITTSGAAAEEPDRQWSWRRPSSAQRRCDLQQELQTEQRHADRHQ